MLQRASTPVAEHCLPSICHSLLPRLWRPWRPDMETPQYHCVHCCNLTWPCTLSQRFAILMQLSGKALSMRRGGMLWHVPQKEFAAHSVRKGWKARVGIVHSASYQGYTGCHQTSTMLKGARLEAGMKWRQRLAAANTGHIFSPLSTSSSGKAARSPACTSSVRATPSWASLRRPFESCRF